MIRSISNLLIHGIFSQEQIERQELDLIKTQYCIDDISNIIDNFPQSNEQFMTSNDELYDHHLKLQNMK
jgi:hypothetical protein